MKKHFLLFLILLVATLVLSSCDLRPFTAPEGTPHEECSKVCKEIYDEYWPDAPISACVSHCQTGKFTAFKSTCNVDAFLDFFDFETKKDCQNYWDEAGISE